MSNESPQNDFFLHAFQNIEKTILMVFLVNDHLFRVFTIDQFLF